MIKHANYAMSLNWTEPFRFKFINYLHIPKMYILKYGCVNLPGSPIAVLSSDYESIKNIEFTIFFVSSIEFFKLFFASSTNFVLLIISSIFLSYWPWYYHFFFKNIVSYFRLRGCYSKIVYLFPNKFGLKNTP